MLISITRISRGPSTTLSTLAVDGRFFCYILEDTDRDLTQLMPLAEIREKKVKGSTAIPEGKYQIIINQSARFKRLLPLLVDVPGFDGIRIHPGNTHLDTEGCLLPGERYSSFGNVYKVLDSRLAFDRLFTLIQEWIPGEKVWCKISNTY